MFTLHRLHKLVFITIFNLIFLLILSCNSKDTGKKKIQLSHGSTQEHPIEVASQAFVEILNDSRGERFEASTFPNGALYNNNSSTLLETLQTGASQMGVESITTFASIVGDISAIQIPFIFDTDEHIIKFFKQDSEILDIWQQKFGEKNLVILGIAPRTFRQLINNKKIVKSPSDLQSMILRVPENPFFVRIFQLLGAKPVPMPSSEIYIAIQLGTVNGEDNSVSNVYDERTYEVANYMTLWNYIADGDMLVINKSFYDSLSNKEQEIFQLASKKWVEVRSDLGYQFEKTAHDKMVKAGVEFYTMSDEEKIPFKELIQPMYDEEKKKLGDIEWNILQKAIVTSRPSSNF